MRTIFKTCLYIVFVCIGLNLTAQELVIQNSTTSVLYFMTSSYDAKQYEQYKDYPETLQEAVKVNNDLMSYVPPLGAVSLGEQPGDLMLMGVLVNPGSDEYPLIFTGLGDGVKDRAFSIGEDDILVDSEGQVLSLTPFDFSWTREKVIVDNRYLDWINIDERIRFASAFVPDYLRVQTSTESKTIGVEESKFWGSELFPMDYVKTYVEQDKLFVLIASSQDLREKSSYYLYFFRNSDSNVESFSLEIPVLEYSGPVVSWDKNKNPHPVGVYTQKRFLLEARIDTTKLPDWWTSARVDVTAAVFDGSYSEEAVYSSFEGFGQ